MHKSSIEKLLLIAAVLIFIILLIFLFYNSEKPQVCFEEKCFNVELAKTDVEKAQGLMFREHLDRNSGMLFIYDEEGSYSFWMKNTLIPLDIIWINSQNKVVDIKY